MKFIIHQFKHVFWELNVSSHWDGSFEYPQHDYAKAEKLVKLITN